MLVEIKYTATYNIDRALNKISSNNYIYREIIISSEYTQQCLVSRCLPCQQNRTGFQIVEEQNANKNKINYNVQISVNTIVYSWPFGFDHVTRVMWLAFTTTWLTDSINSTILTMDKRQSRTTGLEVVRFYKVMVLAVAVQIWYSVSLRKVIHRGLTVHRL